MDDYKTLSEFYPGDLVIDVHTNDRVLIRERSWSQNCYEYSVTRPSSRGRSAWFYANELTLVKRGHYHEMWLSPDEEHWESSGIPEWEQAGHDYQEFIKQHVQGN